MAQQKVVQSAKTDYASFSNDDSIVTALTPFLEGQIDVSVSEGITGTIAPAPAILNSKRITASKKVGKTYKTYSFQIPNAKVTASGDTIRTAGIGKIKVPSSATVLADSIKMTYDGRGAA